MSDEINQGETRTTNSGETASYANTLENAGTYENQGTVLLEAAQAFATTSSIASSGWSVSVTHPVSGRVIHPTVINPQSVQYIPGPNTLPRIRLPTRVNASWLDEEFDDNPTMTVHLDGEQLPIGELVDVEHNEGETILIGEGGPELRQRVSVEYTSEERPTAATNLIQNNTSYSVVDNTTAAPSDTVDAQDPSGENELDDFITVGTTPLQFTGGGIKPAVSCFTKEAEDYDRRGGATTIGRTGFSGGNPGQGQDLSDLGDYVEYDFTLDYEMPASAVTQAHRYYATSDNPEITFSIDGTTIYTYASGIGPGAIAHSPNNGSYPSSLAAGSHTLRVENTDDTPEVVGESWTANIGTFVNLNEDDIISGSESVYDGGTAYDRGSDYEMDYTNGEIKALSGGSISDGQTLSIDYEYNAGTYELDVVATPYDDRYSYTFDNSTDANGYLSGPSYYPDGVDAVFDTYDSAFSITDGSVSVTITDTSKGQALALSNDGGGSYDITGSNTTSISGAFNDAGASINLKATLDRYSPNGTREATPSENYDAQRIDAYDMDATIETVSLLIDQSYNDSIDSVLNDVLGSQYGWKLSYVNDTLTVTLDEPGSTTASSNPQISESQIRKRLKTYRKVIIEGSSLPVSGETFNASTSFVNLTEDDIQTGSEAVYDSSGTQFTRSVDYEMDYSGGQIKILSGGDMSSGTDYDIDYRHTVMGSHTVSGASGDELVRTIPGVVSDRQAEQIAYVLAEVYPGVSTPRYEGRIVVPRLDVGFDPLEGLALEDLDLPSVATPLSIRGEPELTPLGLTLSLGSAPRLEESLRAISQQVSSLSDRV